MLVIALKNPAVDFLSGTSIAGAINEKISKTIHIPQGGGIDAAESLIFPLDSVPRTIRICLSVISNESILVTSLISLEFFIYGTTPKEYFD